MRASGWLVLLKEFVWSVPATDNGLRLYLDIALQTDVKSELETRLQEDIQGGLGRRIARCPEIGKSGKFGYKVHADALALLFRGSFLKDQPDGAVFDWEQAAASINQSEECTQFIYGIQLKPGQSLSVPILIDKGASTGAEPAGEFPATGRIILKGIQAEKYLQQVQ